MTNGSHDHVVLDELLSLDWLTIGAFALTIGAFLGAVLDSYTSLCLVGGDMAHIGRAASCPDVHGWDTRTFPLSVDMGWGGALLATVRLARTIGVGHWRWWVVLVFEVLVAATTVAGNAFHGAVVAGDAARLSGGQMLLVSLVASAVPGVVAVGAGFTLSVLISARHAPGQVSREPEASRELDAVPPSRPVPALPSREAVPPAGPEASRVRPASRPKVSRGTASRVSRKARGTANGTGGGTPNGTASTAPAGQVSTGPAGQRDGTVSKVSREEVGTASREPDGTPDGTADADALIRSALRNGTPSLRVLADATGIPRSTLHKRLQQERDASHMTPSSGRPDDSDEMAAVAAEE